MERKKKGGKKSFFVPLKKRKSFKQKARCLKGIVFLFRGKQEQESERDNIDRGSTWLRSKYGGLKRNV